MMTTNLFVIANVKQLRTGGSFRTLLPFFRTSFNSFHIRVEFGTILEGLRNFRGALNPPPHFGTALGTLRHHIAVIIIVNNVEKPDPNEDLNSPRLKTNRLYFRLQYHHIVCANLLDNKLLKN